MYTLNSCTIKNRHIILIGQKEQTVMFCWNQIMNLDSLEWSYTFNLVLYLTLNIEMSTCSMAGVTSGIYLQVQLS